MARAATNVLVPVGTSLALHGALAVAALLVATRPRLAPQTPVEIQVIDVPAKAPEPPPPPKPLEPVPMKVARAPKLARRTLPPTPTPLPPTDAPPPPTQEAPQNTPQPVIVTGITMESTSQGGSFGVGVGNTMRGLPERTAREPAAARAVRDMRLSPAKVNGVPVATTVPFTIHFTLD